jgi:hypothetical protein
VGGLFPFFCFLELPSPNTPISKLIPCAVVRRRVGGWDGKLGLWVEPPPDYADFFASGHRLSLAYLKIRRDDGVGGDVVAGEENSLE